MTNQSFASLLHHPGAPTEQPPKSCITLHQTDDSATVSPENPKITPSDARLSVTQITPILTLCVSFHAISTSFPPITQKTPKKPCITASRHLFLNFQCSSLYRLPPNPSDARFPVTQITPILTLRISFRPVLASFPPITSKPPKNSLHHCITPFIP